MFSLTCLAGWFFSFHSIRFGIDLVVFWCTLPETNSSHLKIGLPKRKLIFQPQWFRCYVSFREGIPFFLFQLFSRLCSSYLCWHSGVRDVNQAPGGKFIWPVGGWHPKLKMGTHLEEEETSAEANYSDQTAEVTLNGGLVRESPPKWP